MPDSNTSNTSITDESAVNSASSVDTLESALRAAGLSDKGLKLVRDENLSAETLADCTIAQLQSAGFVLGDAQRLKRLYPGASSNKSGFQNLTVQLEAATSTDVSTTPFSSAKPAENEFAYLLGGPSAIGIDSEALKAKINSAFIHLAADGALALVLAGTGMFEIFEQDSLWSTLYDIELRGRIDDWLENVRSGRYISAQSTKKAYEGISGLFGSKFEDLINTAANLASQQQLLTTFGTQAHINVGEDSQAISQLFLLLPLAAEQISSNMQASRLPESSKRLATQAKDFMAILRDPRLADSIGITAPSADEAVIKFLERQIGPSFTNRFRLALAYERLVRALAACPTVVTLDYATILGKLAGDISTLFKIVNPSVPSSNATNGSSKDSYLNQTTRFAFNFSMSLKISA